MITGTLLRPVLIAVVLTLTSASAKEAETGNPGRGEEYFLSREPV
jgi:hypothetical protein